MLILASGRDGDVQIVWCLERGRLLSVEDRMGRNSYVIIVGYGMQRLEKSQNGDDGCTQLARLGTMHG